MLKVEQYPFVIRKQIQSVLINYFNAIDVINDICDYKVKNTRFSRWDINQLT